MNIEELSLELDKRREQYDAKYLELQTLCKQIVLDAFELGMETREDQLLGMTDKSGKQILEDWWKTYDIKYTL